MPTIEADGDAVDLGDIALPEAASIAGTVEGPEGEPQAGAVVDLWGSNRDALRLARAPAGPAPPARGVQARADDRGRFAFADLPPGDFTLRARHNRSVASDPVAVSLETGEHRRGVRIVLANVGLRIEGKLTRSDGRPVAGAVVSAAPESALDGVTWPAGAPAALSGSDGKFAISGLAAGAHRVRVDLANPGKGGNPPDAGDLAPITYWDGVEPGSRALDLAIPAAARIRGKIIGAGGAPAGECDVAIATQLYSAPRKRADAEGRFELKVAPGIAVDITATVRPRDRGANPNEISVTVRGIRAGAEDVVIRLP
jgi:hypothetical protein